MKIPEQDLGSMKHKIHRSYNTVREGCIHWENKKKKKKICCKLAKCFCSRSEV